MLEFIDQHFVIIATLYGLCLGSFFNVCILRYVNEQSIFDQSRSCCPRCHNQLKWWHLVPVFSYIFLKARCGFCNETISPFYPIIETITACTAFILAVKYGLSLNFFMVFVVISLLIIISGIDYKSLIIPDILSLSLAIIALPTAIYVFKLRWLESLAGGVISTCFLYFIMLYYKKVRKKEALGFGDVKLMMGLGFLCGINKLQLMIIISCMLGLFYCLVNKKEQIPFAPFLNMGAAITLFITVILNINLDMLRQFASF